MAIGGLAIETIAEYDLCATCLTCAGADAPIVALFHVVPHWRGAAQHYGGRQAERKRVFDENIPDCTNVHDDSNHYARALGAASPICAQHSIR